MNPVLTITGTYQGADAPGTYVDKASGEVLEQKRRAVIVLLDSGRTIDLTASVELPLPDVGSAVACVVQVGAKVTNFGKAAEPVFTVQTLDVVAPSRRGSKAA